MNCRQCGMKIPPRLLTQDSFRCPRCGKMYRRIQPIKQKRESFLKKKIWGLPVWAISLILLLLIVLLFLIGTIAGGGKQTSSKPATEVASESALQPVPTQIITEAPLLTPFTLSSDDLGLYGRYITLNANTEQEYTYIGHYIPAGKYKVTNNDSATVQITFYSDGTTMNSGVEEPNSGTQYPVVLVPNAEKDVVIQETDYVKLSDDAENTYWEPIP